MQAYSVTMVFMGKGVMLVRILPLERTSGFTCTTDWDADTEKGVCGISKIPVPREITGIGSGN
jgi:hypothetical protein